MTKFYYKYLVVCNSPDFIIKRKYRNIKEILKDLKDSPYPISGRTAVQQILNYKNVNKYRYYHISKIREPLRIKKHIEILDEVISTVPEQIKE